VRRGGATVVLIAIGAWLVAARTPARADEPLLYYTEDGELVITNMPAPGAKRVPGLDEPRAPARRARAALPATEYDAFIEAVARENGLSPDLVKAVALVESGFNPDAVSPKGAQGIMQLMPSTAKRYGVRNAFDPLENLRAGTMHLRSLLDEFDGDVRLALAAYNAGSGAVRRHGGVPAYPETQEYVRKIESTMGKPARRVRAPRPPPPKVQVVQQADGTITFDNIE
jgi:soluble lytic murein transglycosylase-like protein